MPTIDQLPALLRDYVAAEHVMTQVGTQRRGVHSSMAYLAGLIAANLSSWQEYDKAMLWYREALDRAGRAGDRAATGWIAARSTLLAVRRGDHRRVKHQAPTRWPSPRQASWGPPSATRWPRRPPRGWDHREVALMALRALMARGMPSAPPNTRARRPSPPTVVPGTAWAGSPVRSTPNLVTPSVLEPSRIKRWPPTLRPRPLIGPSSPSIRPTARGRRATPEKRPGTPPRRCSR